VTERADRLLTLGASLSQSTCVKITGRGQVTIPPAMRKKHGLLPQREVEVVDQPDGVLVVKASKLSRGKRVLAALLRGGKVKGDTESWLRATRGTA
jgi:bifunctional DNA-binding transcriptional regulator/antitoxin component of YhaV-PrlF toxin-antitoxin module